MSSTALPNLARTLQSRFFDARTRLLLANVYLQILDVLTTIGVLLRGGIEVNPLTRFAIHTAPYPLLGLIAVKLPAIALALYCWRTGRTRALSFVNVFYALLIVWNLVGLVAGCALN